MNSGTQDEQALSVVMAKWGTTAIAESNVLRKRLEELNKIYLIDADINHCETGVFDIQVQVDRYGTCVCVRVVFMGKTADGRFKWRPTCSYDVDWGSGTFEENNGPKYNEDDEGNRLVDDAKMAQWAARLSPCDEHCDIGCGSPPDCCVCGHFYDSGDESESDQAESGA